MVSTCSPPLPPLPLHFESHFDPSCSGAARDKRANPRTRLQSSKARLRGGADGRRLCTTLYNLSLSPSLSLLTCVRTCPTYIHALLYRFRARAAVVGAGAGLRAPRQWSALVVSLLYRTGPWLYYYIARLTNISSAFLAHRLICAPSSRLE